MSDFCLDGYSGLLAALSGRGYEARSFHTFNPMARHLLLRHDLDMSIEAAIRLGAIEADAGWASTHFVLLRTEMYNPFSAAARSGLRALLDQGHEIGLHFDCSLYPDNAAALEEAAARECAMLEEAIGQQIRIISFHRPAKSLLGREQQIAGRPHAYMPRYFSQIGYCSDSQGSWRFGHPLDHNSVIAGTALQLLTHPIWWASDSNVAITARLEAFAESRRQLLRHEIAANCQSFRLTGSDDVG